MKSRGDRRSGQSPSETWREFIQTELKTGSKLGKLFQDAGFGGCDNGILRLYFKTESEVKQAKGLIQPLKNKLQGTFSCSRVDILVGEVPVQQVTTKSVLSEVPRRKDKLENPLQSLIFTNFGQDTRGNDLSLPVLNAAVAAEKTCNSVYEMLKNRTESLVGEDGQTITVDFNWRLRVGGTRGFRELLLPVFHPVFGIPYIPATSLKGAARAWARGQKDSQIPLLLGILQGTVAKAAKVEFLDAFPTQSCLSVDVATPQWHWQADKVIYKPEPHPLLSMERPQLCIGLRPTSGGTASDVQIVKNWLEQALMQGIGSRVSSGYGKALNQSPALSSNDSVGFELWTQGMYGSEPPSRENRWTGKAEFRPTAIRGIVRYWFRSLALSLYSPNACQTLEDELFGKLSKQGKVSISAIANDSTRSDPYYYSGKIFIETTEQKYLELVNQILILASYLGGVGRGSRRPLHLLDINGRKQMRGCNWTLDTKNFSLEYDLEKWQQFFTSIKESFQAVRSPLGAFEGDPGKPKQRNQDVLDKNSQVWLVKSPGLITSEKVTSWKTEGLQESVRGSALNLLYRSDQFKGERRVPDASGKDQWLGNARVGGALETPSFVWISSVFAEEPYQIVTIFGVNHPDRKMFADELEKLRRKREALLILGQMPIMNQISDHKPRRS